MWQGWASIFMLFNVVWVSLPGAGLRKFMLKYGSCGFLQSQGLLRQVGGPVWLVHTWEDWDRCSHERLVTSTVGPLKSA